MSMRAPPSLLATSFVFLFLFLVFQAEVPNSATALPFRHVLGPNPRAFAIVLELLTQVRTVVEWLPSGGWNASPDINAIPEVRELLAETRFTLMSTPKVAALPRIADPGRPVDDPNYPEDSVAIKSSIIAPENEAAVVESWADILQELKAFEKEVEAKGSDIIPKLEFSDLGKVTDEQIASIKRAGAVVIRNIVDDEEALKWKAALKSYVKGNPQVKGWPAEHVQFYEVYWSPSQVSARSHPNVIAAQAFVNGLWPKPPQSDTLISTSTPIVWADRFRIREPGGDKWTRLAPHLDGPSIGRWSDPNWRKCYAQIYAGNWRDHDAYRSDLRIAAKEKTPSVSGSSVFMAWQGWLALSNTGPGEGTLKVFPNPKLAMAYILLRPFFRLVSPDADPYLAESWAFEPKSKGFPGIHPGLSLRIYNDTHPNLKIDTCLVCIPRVQPGDMMFWHNDVPHAVEEEHHGPGDSSVMYIGALPLTLGNAAYVARQREAFRAGDLPPDFQNSVRSSGEGEMDFIGRGSEKDILSVEGRRAMGFESFVPAESMTQGEKELLSQASHLISV